MSPTIAQRIKRRVADFALGDERRAMREAFAYTLNAYLDGPFQTTPQQLVAKVQELDPYLLNQVMWQLGYETLTGFDSDSSAERQRAVLEAKRLWRYSPLAQWSIWLWTGWGLGDRVSISAKDETADVVWQEFWTAERNSPILGDDHFHELSEALLVDGNQFWTFVSSELNGATTMRTLDPTQVSKVITNPDDYLEPWFYKRSFIDGHGAEQHRFYPDWVLYFAKKDGGATAMAAHVQAAWQKLIDAKVVSARDTEGRVDLKLSSANGDGSADLDPDSASNTSGTAVCVVHSSHNRKDFSSLWGWPITTSATWWVRARKQFMQDRLAVASAVAMFVRRKKVKGGSRAHSNVIDTIRSNLSASQYTETNPAPTAGGVEVDNAMIDTKDTPLRTGASDAKQDNEMFTHQALLAMGLFPTSAGLDTSRWATAMEMDKAQSMLFQRYQSWWSAQYRKWVKVVLLMDNVFGNGKHEDLTANISIDTFSLADFPQMAETVGGIVSDALAPFAGTAIPDNTVSAILSEIWRMSLDALGVANVSELTSATAFGVEVNALDQAAETVEAAMSDLVKVIRENVREGQVDWELVAETCMSMLIDDLEE